MSTIKLSPIGKELEKIRIDTGLSVPDFAKTIGLSHTTYSAICRFRRDIDQGTVDTVIGTYATSEEHAGNIMEAAMLSIRRVVLNTGAMSEEDRTLAIGLHLRYNLGVTDDDVELVPVSEGLGQGTYLSEEVVSEGEGSEEAA